MEPTFKELLAQHGEKVPEGTLYRCEKCKSVLPHVGYREPAAFDQVKGNWGYIQGAITFVQNKVCGCSHSARTQELYDVYVELIGTYDVATVIGFTLDHLPVFDPDVVLQTGLVEKLTEDYKQTLAGFNGAVGRLTSAVREWGQPPEGAPGEDATDAYKKPTKFYGSTDEEMGFC